MLRLRIPPLFGCRNLLAGLVVEVLALQFSPRASPRLEQLLCSTRVPASDEMRAVFLSPILAAGIQNLISPQILTPVQKKANEVPEFTSWDSFVTLEKN